MMCLPVNMRLPVNMCLPVNMFFFTCEHVFTCDDVLNGAVLPFINMATVFSLSSSELCEQLLLLPLPPVGGRLGEEGENVKTVRGHLT